MSIRIDEVVATIESDPAPPPPADPVRAQEKTPVAVSMRRELLRLHERAARLTAD